MEFLEAAPEFELREFRHKSRSVPRAAKGANSKGALWGWNIKQPTIPMNGYRLRDKPTPHFPNGLANADRSRSPLIPLPLGE